jgi:hypothetical protein
MQIMMGRTLNLIVSGLIRFTLSRRPRTGQAFIVSSDGQAVVNWLALFSQTAQVKKPVELYED